MEVRIEKLGNMPKAHHSRLVKRGITATQAIKRYFVDDVI